MDKFDLNESKNFALSVKLQFPKFSKGFSTSDFSSFIQTYIGEENLVAIGRLSFPNEWQMQVKANDIRERLIRLGRTKINSRTCWISPLSRSEVRGYVHWIPNGNDESIREKLEPYGEVIFMEVAKNNLWTKKDCDSRYFALNLKSGQTMDDIPHSFKIGTHYGLITIRGRAPFCFRCKEVGHRKSECQEPNKKLGSGSNRKPGSVSKRAKPRRRRYRPKPNPDNMNIAVPSKKKRKKSKASKSNRTFVNLEGLEKLIKPATPQADAMTKVQELKEKLMQIWNLGASQELSSLQSEFNKLNSEMQTLEDTAVVKKEEGGVPLENEDQSDEGKKKKRKKKKKKKSMTTEESSDPAASANN